MPEMLIRTATFKRGVGEIDEEKRTIRVSVSSEYPVARWDGEETLVHSKEAIDMSRFPLPVCILHDTYGRLNIALLEDPEIIGGKLFGTMRFGERDEANEYWIDVKTGIIRNISIGYQISEREITDEGEDDWRNRKIKATRWMIFETSLVSVPADITVGTDRAKDDFTPEKLEAVLGNAPVDSREYIIKNIDSIVEKYRKTPDSAESVSGPTLRSTKARELLFKLKTEKN